MNEYTKALDIWGEEYQIFLAIQEMSELSKELSKYMMGENNIDDIKKEIADVEIMLTELKLIYGSIENEKLYKLRRLREKIRQATQANTDQQV